MQDIPGAEPEAKPETKPSDGADRIAALDGWRAISALMVIVSHLAFGLIDFLGMLGVQIFFAISGYVICQGFMREQARFGRVSLPAFYLRRVFRILPPLALYIVTIVALAETGWVYGGAWFSAKALIFVCNVPGVNCGGWLGAHTWSLSVEEQFYIVIPALFVVFGAVRSTALSAITLALPFAVLALYGLKLTTAATLLSQFVTIGFGVAWALNARLVRRLIGSAPLIAFVLAAVALLLVVSHTGSRIATVLGVLLMGPLIVFLLAWTTAVPSPISRFLESVPLRSLGVVSYSLYLWQQLATFPLAEGDRPGLAFAGVLAAVGFSFLSYRFMEAPLIAAARRLSARLRGKETPA